MIVVLLLLIIASFVSYKKAVLFSAVVFMFMNNLSSGIQDVKFYYVIVLAQVVLFYMLGYHKRKKENYPLLLLVPTLISSVCYIISSFLGTHQYVKNIVNIMSWFYYPYIVWHIMSSPKEVIYYGKVLGWFFVVVAGYALLELLIGRNIYSLWADKAGIIAGDLGGLDTVERFGLLRCNSILPYSSALGMGASIIFMLLVILTTKGKSFVSKGNLLIFLLPLCVLLSGTRSQFIVFALCFMGLLLAKEYRESREMKLLMVIGVVLAVSLSPVLMEIVDSILHSDESSTEGSSLLIRLNQLDIAVSYWLQSPWFGHGRNFTWEVAIPNDPGLLGAESIVFTQLIDHGMVGLVSFYLIGICLAVWCYQYSGPLAILPVAFMVGKTMSTVIGVEYNIPIVLCIFVVKSLTLIQDSQYVPKCKLYK